VIREVPVVSRLVEKFETACVTLVVYGVLRLNVGIGGGVRKVLLLGDVVLLVAQHVLRVVVVVTVVSLSVIRLGVGLGQRRAVEGLQRR
jgi:hypothetical protein